MEKIFACTDDDNMIIYTINLPVLHVSCSYIVFAQTLNSESEFRTEQSMVPYLARYGDFTLHAPYNHNIFYLFFN